jgi:hypothetical protein
MLILLQCLLIGAISAMMVPIYDGPVCASLKNCIARIDLPDAGLVLEVADSVVAANAGRGLFVRLLEGVDSATLDACTAFCGYAVGQMQSTADSAGGKTVAFNLRGPDTSVFFEGALCSVRELLDGAGTITPQSHHTPCTSSHARARLQVAMASSASQGTRPSATSRARSPPCRTTASMLAGTLCPTRSSRLR